MGTSPQIPMKRLIFLLLALISLAGAEENAAPWPPKGYAHVVAFCYDNGKDPRGHQIVFPDKTLHRGIIKAATVRLSKEQSERLVKILTTPKGELEEEDCYDPHHGFVFYDRDWNVVGWFEVCFLCWGYVASSQAVPEMIDYEALEAFTRDAGVPVLKDGGAYGKLFQKENPPPTADGKKEEAPEKRAPAFKNEDPFASDPGQ